MCPADSVGGTNRPTGACRRHRVPATRTLRVHFIAYNPTPQTTPERNRPYVLPGLVEDAPMFKATIVLAQTPRDAQTLNPATRLDHQENRLDLTIADVYEVALIRC